MTTDLHADTASPMIRLLSRLHYQRRRGSRLIMAVAMLALAACGGGGGGSSSPPPPPPPNSAPQAQAGDDVSVDAGAEVVLDGSSSSDSDGSIDSFAWVQTAGTEVEVTGADTAELSFTAPSPTVDLELEFQLTVTDDDGASDTDTITVFVIAPEPVTLVTVGGQILPSASQDLDGDTNDPFNPLRLNDDPNDPQPLGNPTTLGGYVNEPGAGAEGRSQIDGDREDFFLVELLAGQTLNLLVAEFQDADADLYLYDTDGELIDFSIETSELETIAIEESGTYVVNVSIFAGATNYTLAIGSSLTPEDHHYEDVIPDQVILTFDDERTRREDRQALMRDVRLRQLGGGERRARLLAMEEAGSDLTLMTRRLGAQSARRDQFRDPQLAARWSTLLSIKELARQPGVRSAEPNYRMRSLATVNDRNYEFQWHYPLINLPGAWDTTTGDPEIVIAVVDTGILSEHPDIRGQLAPGFDFISDPEEAADGDGIDSNPEEIVGGPEPGAVNFHGTHVAGTIGAAGNNGIGVAGVAFSSRVMPLRALGSGGGTLFDVNQAIRYAAGLDNDSGTVPEQPARVINLSLGGGGFSSASQNLYNELRALGVIVVAAAGNESTTARSFPAAYDNVISVSAVDTQQTITGYSNTGTTIDVAAPGGDGRVDLNGDGYPDGVLSTGSSDGEFAYTFLSGTSMASPHVAGVMALMLSVNPALNADDVDRLLVSGALTDDIGQPGRDDTYGHGLINARKAIEAALAEIGETSNSDPRLSASTSALNFGSIGQTLEFILRNSGGGELSAIDVSASEPWLSVAPGNVDAAGLGTYRVTVDRSSLGPGVYEGQVIAVSDANTVSVRVLLSVADAAESDVGQVYLLIFDAVNDVVVAQATPTQAEEYRFTLRDVPAGSYQFYVGTDLDNDLLICDPGEACGAFLTIDQPLTVELNGDRDDILIPIEYLIALPDIATSNEGSRSERFKNLKRQAR